LYVIHTYIHTHTHRHKTQDTRHVHARARCAAPCVRVLEFESRVRGGKEKGSGNDAFRDFIGDNAFGNGKEVSSLDFPMMVMADGNYNRAQSLEPTKREREREREREGEGEGEGERESVEAVLFLARLFVYRLLYVCARARAR